MVGDLEQRRCATRKLRRYAEVFLSEYAETCGIPWSNVQEHLLDSVSPINVVEVNSRSSGSLNYADHKKSGLNVIAVGGFSLSRGLTLEGAACQLLSAKLDDVRHAHADGEMVRLSSWI